MKKILLISMALAFSLNAKYINGIALTVNNEPITKYDIENLMQNMKISSKEATQMLIKEKLEEEQIQNLRISVNEFDVDKKVEDIARASGLSVFEFRKNIASRGINYDEFRENVATNLKKEQLYSSIISRQSANITKENARAFFEANKAAFKQFRYVNIIRYISKDQNALAAIAKNPMISKNNIKVDKARVDLKEVNPQFRNLFLSTRDKSFTPVFKSPDGYELVYIVSKTHPFVPTFEEAEQAVVVALSQQEKDVAIADYFNKLKASAKIKIIK